MSSADREDPLPPLALSELETSLAHQLRVHGFVAGTPAHASARAAARNTLAVLWLQYQSEMSARVQLQQELRELTSTSTPVHAPSAAQEGTAA